MAESSPLCDDSGVCGRDVTYEGLNSISAQGSESPHRCPLKHRTGGGGDSDGDAALGRVITCYRVLPRSGNYATLLIASRFIIFGSRCVFAVACCMLHFFNIRPRRLFNNKIRKYMQHLSPNMNEKHAAGCDPYKVRQVRIACSGGGGIQ